MTLYILRHGETEFNLLGIVQGSGVDTELNGTGHEQARAFFDTYQDIDFQLVVTSELQRTHQTVRQFIEKDIPWIRCADINEISWGDHEGLPGTPERTLLYNAMIREWQGGNLHASLPNGETAAELAGRVGRFIEWIKTRTEQHILIATHGRTMRCLITLLKGLEPGTMEQVPHANTGLYVVRYQQNAFVLEVENDTRHLESITV